MKAKQMIAKQISLIKTFKSFSIKHVIELFNNNNVILQ